MYETTRRIIWAEIIEDMEQMDMEQMPPSSGQSASVKTTPTPAPKPTPKLTPTNENDPSDEMLVLTPSCLMTTS